MKGKQSFNLLEGSFKLETGRQLILSCFNEQLLIYNKELLRYKMYGFDTQNVETEITKLESKRKLVLDYFKSNELSEENAVIINGAFEITVK